MDTCSRICSRTALLAIFFVAPALICAPVSAQTANSPVSAQTPNSPKYTISGTVVDQQSSLPISDARLTLVEGNATIATTRSDISGAFKFPAVSPALYNILITAAGHESGRSDDIALAGGPATVSLVLAPSTTANTGNSLKTIAHVTTRAGGLQTTTTIQQQIDPNIIQNQGNLRVAESLGKLPGVNMVGSDSAIGDDISVDIRGLKPSETQVLLDGHPIGPIGVYPARIGGGTGGYDYQVSPTFALQNIQVVYGSGATGLYGVDAVGGAVDFQTLNPSLRPSGTLKIGTGMLGKQLSAVQTAGTSGKFAWVLLHGVTGAYGNFPGAVIPQTGLRGTDFTSATYSGVTYWVGGDYVLRNDLGKIQYAFSPATTLSFTGYSATSRDDKTGEGDNDFITPDYATYQAQQNTNCSTPSGVAGIKVMVDSGSACYTPQQYGQGASGPAGGGPGAFQALANQDYHARLTTSAGRNQIVLDSYIDNYSQNRERPESFVNGPLSILNVTYRSIGSLLSDDIAFSKNDVGFGAFSMRQYTNGQNISGTNVIPHAPIFDKLDSFFVRDVYEPGGHLSFFLNSWLKHSNVGGNSFDPRLSIIYRPTLSDVFRLTGGKSSADPAPLAPQLTGIGGITPGNCKLISVGEAQSPNELPERASDLEASYAHHFTADTNIQLVAYDTNEINTIFQGQEPAADFLDFINQAGANYLPSVFAKITQLCPSFQPPNPGPTIANLVVNTNLNLARERARGLELSGRMRITPHLAIDGYYDLQSAMIFDAPQSLLTSNVTLINGSQLPEIPLHKFGLAVDITNTHGAEIYIDYTHLDSNNSFNRPAFGWADAMLTQSVSKQLSLNLGITNVFNSAVDNYGRIGWGVYVPENEYGTDANALAQGTERFGLLPTAVTFSLTEKF